MMRTNAVKLGKFCLIALALGSCRHGDVVDSSVSKNKSESAESPKYEELEKQAQDFMNTLSKDDQNYLRTRAKVAKDDVGAMSESTLKSEFMRLTKAIYSTEGWSKFSTLIHDESPNLKNARMEASSDLFRYAAIRIRVNERFPWMKEDVYNELFGNRDQKSGLIEINRTQFMDPTMMDPFSKRVLWGFSGVALFALGRVIAGLDESLAANAWLASATGAAIFFVTILDGTGAVNVPIFDK